MARTRHPRPHSGPELLPPPARPIRYAAARTATPRRQCPRVLSERGLHPDRTAGGHRHHCLPGGDAAAGPLAAKEKAKVTRAHVELNGVGLALEMYSEDNAAKLPPVRVNCNTDLATHWCDSRWNWSNSTTWGRAASPAWPRTWKTYSIRTTPTNTPRPARNYSTGPRRQLPALGARRRAQLRQHQRPILLQPQRLPVRWVIWSMGPKPDGSQSRRIRADGPPKLVLPHRRRRGHRPLPNPRWRPIQEPMALRRVP